VAKAESILNQAEIDARNARKNSLSTTINRLSSMAALANAAMVQAIQTSVSDISENAGSSLSLPIVTGQILSQWIASNMTTDSTIDMLDSLSSEEDSQISLGIAKVKSFITNSTGQMRTVSKSAKSLLGTIESNEESIKDMQTHLSEEASIISSAADSVTNDGLVDVSPLTVTSNYQSDESTTVSEIQTAIDDISAMIKTAR
jgi:hypothetical protein